MWPRATNIEKMFCCVSFWALPYSCYWYTDANVSVSINLNTIKCCWHHWIRFCLLTSKRLQPGCHCVTVYCNPASTHFLHDQSFSAFDQSIWWRLSLATNQCVIACYFLLFLYCLQACDDLSKWTVLLGSSLVCGPRIESISFIIEAAGHRVGCHSAQTSKKKVGTTHCFTNNILRAIILI